MNISTEYVNGLEVTRYDRVVLENYKIPAVPDGVTPTSGVKAVGTLTFAGVVADGQTVTIGTDVYEFDTNVAITTATGTLTISGVVADGQTITIGERVYEFDTGDGVTEGNVAIDVSGAVDAASAVNAVVASIAGDDDAEVTAENGTGNTVVVTAKVAGAAGNIASTETMTNGSWGGATLTGGAASTVGIGTGHKIVDVSGGVTASDAVTALVAAITANTGSPVTAADGAGDTVVVTAKTAGAAGNAIVTTETCTNASWGHDHLLTGADPVGIPADGMVGSIHYQDTNYIYGTNPDGIWWKIQKTLI